ncbi:MAG: DUF1592 domain-containing protein, partial [Verrucomicrobiales bacterium]|nr:DUF1592 domain-containing protein [Verrucomicrobiales bacterium]
MSHSLLLLTTCLLLSQASLAQDPLTAAFTRDVAPVLEAYCTGCHGGEKTKGDVDLTSIRSLSDALEHPVLLEDILAQIDDGEMPPDDERQPTTAEKTRLTAWIRAALDSGDDTDDPGRTTVRRLNKTEYRNTVRDLFGVDFNPGRGFPADGSGGAGFDNTADALFLPPVLMEKYLAAAGGLLEQVFASDKLARPLLTPAPSPGRLTPENAAGAILERFLSRAFRRPVSDEEIARYRSLADTALDRGDTFPDALKLSLKAALVSPHFLFRIEITPPGTSSPYAVPPFELASRLSYFLWSSMPDAGLFSAAGDGTLTQPPILAAQVDRMLADPKVTALSHNFAAQWLGFDELIDKVQPDGKRFPMFTPDVRAAMYREGTLFFHHMVSENRPLTDLVDADYTFINAPLARIYDIPGITGNAMRKVTLTEQSNRGGVLTMGGVLAATSLPLRTSPVVRGRWVLEDIIGDPPPPPP